MKTHKNCPVSDPPSRLVTARCSVLSKDANVFRRQTLLFLWLRLIKDGLRCNYPATIFWISNHIPSHLNIQTQHLTPTSTKLRRVDITASFKYSLGRAPSRRSKIQFRRRTKCPSKGKCASSSFPEPRSGSSGLLQGAKSETSVPF